MIRVVLLLPLLTIITEISSEKILKFYNTECAYNKKYISNYTCNLKVKGRDVVLSNGEFILKEHVKNARIHVELFKYEDRFKPFLLNVTFYICDVFKSTGLQNVLVKTVVTIIEKVSNIIKCGHEVRFSINIFYKILNV